MSTRQASAPDEVPIGTIRVGCRVRKALGDLDALAASMHANGLLHPLVITPTRELIAGERRLLAARKLGWAQVPVRVIDPPDLLRAEIDENAQRLDLTPSEAVAIAALIRPVEQQAAKARTGGRPRKGETSANFAEVSDQRRGHHRLRLGRDAMTAPNEPAG